MLVTIWGNLNRRPDIQNPASLLYRRILGATVLPRPFCLPLHDNVYMLFA